MRDPGPGASATLTHPRVPFWLEPGRIDAGGLAVEQGRSRQSRRQVRALLDVNLGSETSIAVARKLADVGIPYSLATGYSDGFRIPDRSASWEALPITQSTPRRADSKSLSRGSVTGGLRGVPMPRGRVRAPRRRTACAGAASPSLSTAADRRHRSGAGTGGICAGSTDPAAYHTSAEVPRPGG